MRLKKLLCLTLASVMTLSLAACGGGAGKDDTTAAATESKEETTAKGSEEASAGGEKTLKVAAVETAYGQEMWKEVCAAFEKANPGVKVELTIDKKMEDIVTPQMKSGEYPDVVFRSVGAVSALAETFIKDNNVVDLTDVLSMTVPGESKTVKEKILPGFLDNTIVNPYGDGKTYLMPMFYSPCGLFYNAGLLKAKGWEVPETWDQMWELGEKAKAENIALFTYPTAGYFDAFLYSLLHQTMGADKFKEALNYKEGIWDTAEAKQAFEIIGKLASYTEKTTPGNANDNDFTKNQQMILDNQALFMPNGTWITGEMGEAPRADGFEWGFTSLPAVKEGGERASYTFFEQLWMPKGAVNQELGKQFIAYLYSDEAAGIFRDKSTGNGAVQPILGMSDKMEGEQKMFYSIYDRGAVAVMDAFATTDPVEGITVRTTFLDPVNSVVTGDKTIEDWLTQIKADSDQLRGALKK